MNRKFNSKVLIVSILICCGLFVLFVNTFEEHQPPNAIQGITVKRCANNPLITFDSSPSIGDNINGPSVIRVPEWVQEPLGRYYMYFAHHQGTHIRMAYADNLAGPWTIYEPGVLGLDQVPVLKNHIASPDVHIDPENRVIRMYFHGPLKAVENPQRTVAAESKDGLLFIADNKILGRSYFRVFKWRGHLYAVSSSGHLSRLETQDGKWNRREKKLVPAVVLKDGHGSRTVKMRHTAVLVNDGRLYLFYTRKGDAPERIVMSTVRLTDDWHHWTASEPIEVMRPQEIYEGIQYPIRPSTGGQGTHVRQIRDPYLFQENGKLYLFYAVAGETGIAMAEITLISKEDVGFHSD